MNSMVKTFLLFALALGGAAEGYEAPQICCLGGVSVSYTRAEIEARLGPSRWDRPLKASWGGETWEYTYANGLVADFADRDRGRHALLLVGKQLTSRGITLVKVGASRQQVRQAMNDTGIQVDDQMVYHDPDRKVFTTFHFGPRGVDEIVLSRFRIDSQRDAK